MLNITTDIQPLSHLIQHPDEVVAQVERTGNPVVLTVDGKAKMVVMDAAEYDALHMDPALRVSIEDLQESIEDAAAGRVRPMREAFVELLNKHGL